MERKSLQPIYIQVAESLKLKIEEGYYQPGSKTTIRKPTC